MSKDPAVLFYTNDFLAGTITMSDEQVGKYMRLLCIQHQKGILTPKDMLNICKTYDEDVYCKFVKDGEGNYYNERMKNESDRRKRYSESRKANRDSKPEKPVNKRKQKSKIISESYDLHMETETVNETVNKRVNKNKSGEFSIFWEVYPRKVGKIDAEKAWIKTKDRPDIQTIIESIEAHKRTEQWQKDGGQYIPHPARFINRGGWFDEIEAKPEININRIKELMK